jgi:hypothetical protein
MRHGRTEPVVGLEFVRARKAGESPEDDEEAESVKTSV